MNLSEYERLALHLHIASCLECRTKAYNRVYRRHVPAPAGPVPKATLWARLRLRGTQRRTQ